MQKVVILGGGWSGFTCALFLCRNKKDTYIITGDKLGGQIIDSPNVENYPSVPEEGISGEDLMDSLIRQSKKAGVNIINSSAKNICKKENMFEIILSNGEKLLFDCVVVATGSKPKFLNLENEQNLFGHGGISTCANCDATLYFQEDVVIVGGGNVACEDALLLSEYCNKVFLVHRRNELTCEEITKDLILNKPNIEIIWNTVIEKLVEKDNNLNSVEIKNLLNGQKDILNCKGLFLAIGSEPNTKFLKNFIELDEKGYVKTREEVMTNIDGVFAIGDCTDGKIKLLTACSHTGVLAHFKVIEFLNKNSKRF